VHTSASTTDRNLPAINIRTLPTAASRTYVLPKDSPLHHATQYAFDYLKEKQVWFAQDAAEAFPLVVYNQLDAIKQAGYSRPPQVLPPADIYIRKCTAKTDLHLYLMASTEESSRRHLMGLRHRTRSARCWTRPSCARTGTPCPPQPRPRSSTSSVRRCRCSVTWGGGTRGDQDEIMVSHSAARVASGAARGRESACG